MNPTSSDLTAPPPAPPRSSFSCDRHTEKKNYTGFCTSCLCERLTTLDNSSANTPSTNSRRPSSAIKSIFSGTGKSNNNRQLPLPKPTKPELRRTQSFSASKKEALGLSLFEPQRKSCDVRGGRNTLWSLFTIDDNDEKGRYNNSHSRSHSNRPSSSSYHQTNNNLNSSSSSSKKMGTLVANRPVSQENRKDFIDHEILQESADDGDEIRPVIDSPSNMVELGMMSSSVKPMKIHIDLETRSGGGGFWSAASVFSKKWNQWRHKERSKNHNNGKKNFAKLPVDKPITLQFRETQSEIADYGFGRMSCDTDPRFSLDASFEEPRASWDGYFIGKNILPRMAPMVSVMEDVTTYVHVLRRPDMQIPDQSSTSFNVDESGGVPGGSAQTQDYYTDSSSRRNKSLDRSSSIRKNEADVVDEINELKMVEDSNGMKKLDDCSKNFEFRDRSNSLIMENVEKKDSKKSRSWRLWGLIRNGGLRKDEDDEGKSSRVNRSISLSESYRGGDGNVNGQVFRSNSSSV